MLIAKRCLACDGDTRIQETGGLYQVVCIKEGHTCEGAGRVSKALAVMDWNIANMPITYVNRKLCKTCNTGDAGFYKDCNVCKRCMATKRRTTTMKHCAKCKRLAPKVTLFKNKKVCDPCMLGVDLMDYPHEHRTTGIPQDLYAGEGTSNDNN